MEVSISYVSSNRKVGKAFRRVIDEIKALEKECLGFNLKVERLELWMVDRPIKYVEVIKKTEKLLEVHFGCDETLTYLPNDDDNFVLFLKEAVDTAIQKIKESE